MDTNGRNETGAFRSEGAGQVVEWKSAPADGLGATPITAASGHTQQLMVIRESGTIQFSRDSADKLLDASLSLLGALFVVVLVERRLRRWLHE